MILVDTNVAIDALDARSENHEWAIGMLAHAIGNGAFFNHIIVAELAARVVSKESLDDMLMALDVPVEALDVATAYLAGRAFVAWIERGGRRGALLPDFLIGAHAMARGAAILTRDARRFRTYFPELTILTPETHPNG